MIELPECLTIASQLNETVLGKRVLRVLPPTKPHKFCWFAGAVQEYDEKLSASVITGVSAFGMFVEIAFDSGKKLCINDGVNVRLVNASDAPKSFQLLIVFDDAQALCFTVAMYGGIILHDGEYDNEYYEKSKNAVSPFETGFHEYFKGLLNESKPSLSMKAFLATEQRFPGIGNGAVQDILFTAGLHPKRKLATLSSNDCNRLFSAIISVLTDMTALGGRDTEKDIFGAQGGYKTKMSKKSIAEHCPVCGGEIIKEAYLGGSVYYCPACQPLTQNDI